MANTNTATVFINAGVLGERFVERRARTIEAAKALASELLPGVIIQEGAPRRGGRQLRPLRTLTLFVADEAWTGSTPGKRPVGMINER